MLIRPRSDYDRCPTCEGWKRIVAKRCSACHLASKRRDDLKVCPDCGGSKYINSVRCRPCALVARSAPRIQKKSGYVVVAVPGHPLADVRGRVLEHRLVVHNAGIDIPDGHHVHHKNGIRHDNRLQNLEVIEGSEHIRRHVHAAGWITNQFGTFPIQQHGVSAYHRGCRCDVCRKANTDYCRAYNQRRRQKVRG